MVLLKHLIIGTAGHVDHGKTMLIRALTGVDTDRLREEKKRGISIDLGFAPLELPGGRLAGIVDVPGHERFIHNMLAGAAGMDLVLLVVDATEGIMPQTREHLQILQLLGLQKGIVALTKIELVDEEWLELIEEEIAAALKGTFLAGSPLQRVSAFTGKGITALKELILSTTGDLPPRDSTGPLRLPVDRSFSIAGFGTVITGTLFRGSVAVGDKVEIIPPGLETRVRNIQIHEHDRQKAQAGQRVALNLAAVDKSNIQRGSVIATPGYYRPTAIFDASFELLPGAPRPLKNLDPLHLFLGTARTVARLLLLDCEEIKPGERRLVQCRLDHPLVADRADLFIARSYSPMTTIGGGRVLDPAPSRHRRFRRSSFAHLGTLEQDPGAGGDEAFVFRRLSDLLIADLQRLGPETRLDEKRLQGVLESLMEKGSVERLGRCYLTRANLEEWERRAMHEIEEYHRRHHLLPGISRAQLKGALPRELGLREYDLFLERLQEQKRIAPGGERVSRRDFLPRPSPEERVQLERITDLYARSRFLPPTPGEALEKAGIKGSGGEDYFSYLLFVRALVKINEEIYFHREAYEAAVALLRHHFASAGTITLARFRDLTGSSRKIVQPLLEHFDQLKLTRRVGDHRIPLKLLEADG